MFFGPVPLRLRQGRESGGGSAHLTESLRSAENGFSAAVEAPAEFASRPARSGSQAPRGAKRHSTGQAPRNGARWDARWSRFWNYTLLAGLVVGGLVATVSGSIATQNADASWPGYAAAIAGAVVAACAAAPTKLKPVEKLKFALVQLADFENVAMKAEKWLGGR